MENKKQYALYIGKNAIKLERSGLHDGYGTLNIGVVELFNGDKIMNPAEESGFRDLVFHAQWDRNQADRHTYGWSARYQDVYMVDYNDATRMTKTLKKLASIESRAKIMPTTFGQYVVTLALGLGIKKLARLSRYNGGSYSENIHQILDIKDAQFLIDNLITTAQEEDAKAS